jgi:hypothetical protein
MADYKDIQNLSSQKSLPFFTFYTKGNKPVKAVIRHSPNNTSSEDITLALQELGYEVISVKRMTGKRPSAEGLVTLPSPLSYHSGKKPEVTRYLQDLEPLQHNCQSRGVQVQTWSDSMLQLPALRPHLGPLQAAFSLHVVRGWSSPPRMSEEREHTKFPQLLQL